MAKFECLPRRDIVTLYHRLMVFSTRNAKDFIMQHKHSHICTIETKCHLLALKKIRILLNKGVHIDGYMIIFRGLFLCRLHRLNNHTVAVGYLVGQGFTTEYPSHKSSNASDRYHTLHGLVPEMCTRAHFCYKMVHCGTWHWWIVGLVPKVLASRPAGLMAIRRNENAVLPVKEFRSFR